MRSVLLLLALVPLALTASITWTGGGGNNLWSVAGNWNGNSVPTINDDVVINVAGGAQVQISQAAVAKSVVIAGGNFAQTLTLLSSLSVGSGGVIVNANGEIQLSSNPQLPLSSSGAVTVSSGGTLTFQSGGISGPGIFTIQNGAALVFSTNSLKQIAATTLLNYGAATIQASAIQLAAAGSFNNYGNLTIFGQVQIFSSDSSATSIINNGNFIYNGNSNSQPLQFQVATTFNQELYISSGAVILAASFKSNSSVWIPAGGMLTVNSDPSVKILGSIKGLGTFVAGGNTQVSGPAAVSNVQVTDAGNLQLGGSASFVNVVVGGILQVSGTNQLSVTNLDLAGGTLQGPGVTSVSGNLTFSHSDTNNDNNFIAGTIQLYGQGYITASAYLLFNTAGLLHVMQGATLTITDTTNFQIQGGAPEILVDGTIDITLPATQTIAVAVNIEGPGSVKVNSGIITFTPKVVTLGNLFLAAPAFAIFQGPTVTIGTISGAGGFNLTAAPTPVSSIGSVALNNFGVINGAVNIGSFAVTTFNFYTGTVVLSSSSANTAEAINLYGGSISGSAKISISEELLIAGNFPITISGLAIATSSFKLTTVVSPFNLQTLQGATIISTSNSFGMRSLSKN